MRHLSLAAIAVLLLAACGAAVSTGPSTTPPAADGLAGRQFWSTAVVGHDLAPGTRVTLTFRDDGTLGAQAGCNMMGGTWSLDGTTLRIEIGAMTEMACAEDRMAQDEWLASWLAGGLTAATEGDELVLTGAGVTMTLLDEEVANPDQSLEGTTWVLDGLEVGVGADGTVSSVPGGVRATIRIEDGDLAVDTGCNTGSASATVDGATLTIGPIALTRMACEPAATEVERFMTQILQGEMLVEVDGTTLRVTGPNGGLTFQAE